MLARTLYSDGPECLLSLNPFTRVAVRGRYSLVETTKANGLVPFDYLMQVFTQLPALAGESELARYHDNPPERLKTPGSQRHRMNWARFSRLCERWIPSPRIMHPYPMQRFHARTRSRSRMR
ncbi:transposase domain-containing protein [Serratia sp. UGAL515B_01]|uniref:transposase domain-containing protein n=1 Tax=Serratia sp. UGAL515B_01 TaxID=2986763 RepID=UPI002954CF85|nr:transposase domain-containing protein [Serratia sp. UGAL515B_01]WON77759.1 transposase domain-containing protein [Serratia sp. UGAL515B_01]